MTSRRSKGHGFLLLVFIIKKNTYVGIITIETFILVGYHDMLLHIDGPFAKLQLNTCRLMFSLLFLFKFFR